MTGLEIPLGFLTAEAIAVWLALAAQNELNNGTYVTYHFSGAEAEKLIGLMTELRESDARRRAAKKKKK